jgi:hypothetical protein
MDVSLPINGRDLATGSGEVLAARGDGRARNIDP